MKRILGKAVAVGINLCSPGSVYWGYMGMMEKNTETTGIVWVI